MADTQATTGISSLPLGDCYGIYVGPEGGFTPQESLYLRDSGCHGVSLGDRILRTETAGVVSAFFLRQRCSR